VPAAARRAAQASTSSTMKVTITPAGGARWPAGTASWPRSITHSSVANPDRRDRLADAGLALLAREGARGVTYRAVERAAGLPAGTTSNYFRSRDELMAALAARIYERLAPDPEVVAQAKKLDLPISAQDGATQQKVVSEVFAASSAVPAILKEAVASLK